MKKVLTYVFVLLFVGSLVACKNRNKKTETKTQKAETSIVKKSSATSKTTKNNATSHVHTFDSEWNYNNDYHWHDASCGCDVISQKELHTFGEDIEITVTPTFLSDGSGKVKCIVCGKEKEVTVDAYSPLGKTYVFDSVGMDYENATDEDWVAAKIEEEKDGETNEAWISYITSKYDDMLLKVSSFKINESTVTQTATMGAESMSMDLPSNIYELNIVALEMVLHFQDENTIYFIYKTWGEDLGGGETTENIQLLYIFKALPQE